VKSVLGGRLYDDKRDSSIGQDRFHPPKCTPPDCIRIIFAWPERILKVVDTFGCDTSITVEVDVS
jgi:hypothetical protein